MATRSRLVQLRRMPVLSAWTRNRALAAAPPAPPPPPWPALELWADFNWQGPWTPLPNWNVTRSFGIPWDNFAGWYHGISSGDPDRVEIYFHLDLFNGNYFAHMIGWRGDVDIMSISTETATVTKGEWFEVEHNEWIGLPPDHACWAQFSTSPPL